MSIVPDSAISTGVRVCLLVLMLVADGTASPIGGQWSVVSTYGDERDDDEECVDHEVFPILPEGCIRGAGDDVRGRGVGRGIGCMKT